jgi:hypothetical protein
MGKVKMTAPQQAAIEDEWQRRASAAAIESARKTIGGAVPTGVPVGKLSDHELGWLVMSGICAWIKKRAEQATAEGFNLSVVEEAIRDTGTTPAPWDAGAVATILPDLAQLPGIDWSLSLNDWPQETMISFLCTAFDLFKQAMAARDAVDKPLTRPEPVLNDGVEI